MGVPARLCYAQQRSCVVAVVQADPANCQNMVTVPNIELVLVGGPESFSPPFIHSRETPWAFGPISVKLCERTETVSRVVIARKLAYTS